LPLTLSPFTNGASCRGSVWTILDEDHLAALVARVLLGHYRHVMKLLAGIPGAAPATPAQALAAVQAKLVVPEGKDPWHRDGLLFQIISWIASNREAGPDGIVRYPHIQEANKGFDNVRVVVEPGAEILSAVVIGEDKATDDPRGTVRDKVWPEILILEAGERDHELMQEITHMLAGRPDLDVDTIISSVVWERVRRYRVSVTVGAGHATPAGRRSLFKGYETVAQGDDVERRSGCLLVVDDLRPWMEKFAKRVSAAAAEAAVHV
jgi:hypothetical protein